MYDVVNGVVVIPEPTAEQLTAVENLIALTDSGGGVNIATFKRFANMDKLMLTKTLETLRQQGRIGRSVRNNGRISLEYWHVVPEGG